MSHPQSVSRTATGLLVVDMQDKFQPVIAGFDELVENVVRLVLTFNLFEMPIVVSEQYPKGLGRTVETIRKALGEFEPIEKMAFSVLADSAAAKRLKAMKLKSVVVCGIETHVCVCQTVLDLLDAGYTVHVVADGISTRKGLDHRMGWEKMLKAGAVPATTEMVMFELTGGAAVPEFPKVQQMVTARLKKKPAATLSDSALRRTGMFSPSATSAPPAPSDEPAPDIGPARREEDVIATVDAVEGDTVGLEPAPAKEETEVHDATDDIEVLDIETLVDLRGAGDEHKE